jgi:hypothetical protein
VIRRVEAGRLVRSVRERGGLITQTEDVAVDARGNIYVTDKQWGVFVLRYTGAQH